MDTLIGGAIAENLRHQGYTNLVEQGDDGQGLTDAGVVDGLFSTHAPEYVFLAGGESGGIAANEKMPAQLMLNNLVIDCNVIGIAHRYGVKKLIYLASSCVYPRDATQPLTEQALMSGPLEPTNEAYAVAKLAGLKLCQAYRQQHGANFICGIPANAFGPGDDFRVEESHVIPGLIRRMHDAKVTGMQSVEIWGTGEPRREFIYVNDLADATVFIMNKYDGDGPINLGGHTDVSIGELALLIKETVGYTGQLSFDRTRPDGMPLKGLDSSTLAQMGWRAQTDLQTALKETYVWYLNHELAGNKTR